MGRPWLVVLILVAERNWTLAQQVAGIISSRPMISALMVLARLLTSNSVLRWRMSLLINQIGTPPLLTGQNHLPQALGARWMKPSLEAIFKILPGWLSRQQPF